MESLGPDQRDGRFEALAESAPDAILTIDQQSIILSANPATERLFGYAPDELVGRSLTTLIPERLRPAHSAGIARYVQTGRRNIPWVGVELPGLTKDGREIPLEISFGEFVDAAGRRVFSGFVRDVSERVRHRQALADREEELERLHAESERRREEAEAAVRLRDDVLSIVSHDLLNPVSTVAMSVALLRDSDMALSEEERGKQLEVIARSAHRMSRLIEDLLDVARIEGGRFVVSCKWEDPGALAAEACEAFRSIAAEKSLEVECRIESGLPRVYVDRDRVIQALSNYLSNAIKFTLAGGRVGIGATPNDDGGVRFFVSDTGPGIQADELPHLFGRFWQARRTAHLGAGLGLAIARGIANAHGGRVWADSVPGSGSTFHLTVPGEERCT